MIYWIIIIGLIVIVGGFLSNKPEHTYTAHFGNAFEYLSFFNHGIAVTGNKAITKKLAHTNVALFGPTGSGKSTIVIISSAVSLARGKSSIIFNDVSGEVYDRTSAYLAKQGYKILRLDFSNSNYSQSFNPLLICRTIQDIQRVSLLIVHNAIGESKSEPFWEQSSIMLISLFIRYLVFYADQQFRTLQNVLRLIEKFAVDTNQEIDKMFAKTDEELLSSYKATLVMGEKTLQSVIATARTALSLWNDKEVCRTTATNSINFDLLRGNQPVALYVCNPLKDLIYFKPISALFFQTLFNHVLSRIPGKEERSIFFLLDEFAIFRFPGLVTTASNIRKFSSGLVLCMQDEMALISQYGQADAHQIKTNCGCQVYLKGQPLHTCTELSKILGKYTYKEEKGEKVRELMTPDEIRMCNDAIILINNSAPLRCATVPYFENIFMQHLLKESPYPLSQTNVVEPPLIPFK